MSHVPSYTITKPATTQAGKLGRGGCAPLVPSFPPSSPSPPRVRLAHRPQRACAGHADYPYRPGRFLDDVYPESPRFGVQYNVCVDEFTPENVSRSIPSAAIWVAFFSRSHRHRCRGPRSSSRRVTTAGAIRRWRCRWQRSPRAKGSSRMYTRSPHPPARLSSVRQSSSLVPVAFLSLTGLRVAQTTRAYGIVRARS